MNFDVFGNAMKHFLECLIYLTNQNLNYREIYGENGEIYNTIKSRLIKDHISKPSS